MERMQWIVQLIDRMSGPARNISVSLKDCVVNLSGMDKEVKRATVSWASFTSALDHGLNILGRMVGVVERIAGVLYGGAKFALGALAFKETTQESFKLMLGTQEAADEVFKQAMKFAAATPFETRQVLEAYRDLLSAGFKTKEVPIVFQALGDISAASGFDPQVMGAITRQLAQMKAVGKATMMDVRPIIGWSGQAGIGFKAVNETLAKMLHTSASAIPAMISAGQVSADAWTYAFVKTVKERTAMGEVGSIMLAQSRTLTGLWSTIASTGEDFFYRMKKHVGEMAGIEQLKGAMQNFIDLMGEGSPQAERLGNLVERVFGDLFSTIFGPLNGPEGLEGMRTKMDQVLTKLEAIDWKKIFTEAKEFIETTTEAVVALAKAVGWLVHELNELNHGGYKQMVAAGAVKAATPEQIAGSVPVSSLGPQERFGDQWFKAGLHWLFGDSEVEKQMRVVKPEALASMANAPHMAEGGIVNRPTFALIGEAGPEAVVPLGALGGGGEGDRHIEIHELHIHVHGADTGDAHSIAQALSELSPAALAVGLERLADEVG